GPHIAAEHKNIPTEGVAICVLAPADDVAFGIFYARVGGIGFGAGGVVGEGKVNLASGRMHGAPFGAIHFSRTHQVGGSAGVNQQVGLVGEADTGEGSPGDKVHVGDIQR